MSKGIYLYIHIPFCYKKCPYCAFVSYEKQLSAQALYIKRVIDEIKGFKTSKIVQSIYFGGGTPSTLKIKQIESVLDAVYSNFAIHKDAEITFESNPVSLKTDYLKGLKSLGINRLSIGVQSFIDLKLNILGRLHNGQKAIESVKNAQDRGFENISIDLIYGLNETKKDMEFELKNACFLDVQHISTYMLSIEEGTQFEKLFKSGKLKISNDDDTANLYFFISYYLKSAGYKHYEISNFAKQRFESKHNSAYWLGYDYRGFGVSASSFVEGIRFKNTDSLDSYINKKNYVVYEKQLDEKDKIKEAFVLLLRMKDGVKIECFNKRYKTNIKELYKKELDKFEKLDMIKEKNGHIFLNGAKAMVVSNTILSEFI